MPKLKKRGRVYHAWIFGKLLSTKCTDREAALIAAARLERTHADPNRAAAAQATLELACREFLTALDVRVKTGDRSDGTYSMRDQHCGHICRVLGREARLSEIGPMTSERYLAARVKEGAGSNTISKEIGTLRLVMRGAKRRGEWSGDEGTLKPEGLTPKYKPLDRWLDTKQLSRLMAVLPPERAALCAWLVLTASDWSWALQAQRSDVDRARSVILVGGSKTQSRKREVPIISVFAELLTYVEKNTPSEGLMFGSWDNVRRDLAVACERARIPRITPRDLRRSTGKWLRAAGIEPQLIARVMGHTDSRMVERVYGRVTADRAGELIELDLRRRAAPALSAKAEGNAASTTGAAVANDQSPTDTEPSKFRAEDGNAAISLDSLPIENPRVGGSIPSRDTRISKKVGSSRLFSLRSGCEENSV